jgi:hypothetical protein
MEPLLRGNDNPVLNRHQSVEEADKVRNLEGLVVSREMTCGTRGETLGCQRDRQLAAITRKHERDGTRRKPDQACVARCPGKEKPQEGSNMAAG